MRDAFVRAAGLHQGGAEVVTSVRIGGIKIHGVPIGLHGGAQVACILQNHPQSVPGVPVPGIGSYGGLQMWQGVRIFALRLQDFPQPILVIEVGRVQSCGALQVGNAQAGIILHPVGRAQMILRRRELRVQIEGPLEALNSLFAAVQDCQKKAHFVLQVGRFGVQFGRLPINLECACSITLGFQSHAAFFQILHRIGSVGQHTQP
jgi:hypothetical protein